MVLEEWAAKEVVVYCCLLDNCAFVSIKATTQVSSNAHVASKKSVRGEPMLVENRFHGTDANTLEDQKVRMNVRMYVRT